jgi:DNA-binding transcriptional ArsR family regulator
LITENIYDSLIDSLFESKKEIVSILKSLGNEVRFQILLNLLSGEKSFGNIVDGINKEKTAVANHLTHLLRVQLIEKGNFGIYKINGDGIEFMKSIDSAFKKSPTRQLKRFQDLQSRQISNSFLNRFSQ